MRAGVTADTEHVMANQHQPLVLLLLKGSDGTRLDTMRVFTSSADEGIGGQLSHGANAIIIGQVMITTLDGTCWTLMRGTDIKVNEQSLVGPSLGFQVQLRRVQLFRACYDLEFFDRHHKERTLGPQILETLDSFVGKHRSVVTDVIGPQSTMATFANSARHIFFHGEIDIPVLETHL